MPTIRAADGANLKVCIFCGVAGDVMGTVRRAGESVDRPAHTICFQGRNNPPAKPERETPRQVDPRSGFSASQHKTRDAARDRAAKVAAYLGVVPENLPRDPNAEGPFMVCPDSPLVPGFKAAPNPYDN
jgi:hypothetical protein